MDDAVQQIISLFERGGPVMWPLLALSIVSVAMSIERLIFWLGTRSPARRKWLRSVIARLGEGDRAATEALIAKDTSVYANVTRALLDTKVRETIAIEMAERFRPALERFSTTHSTIITAAPLLGILGTVLGIIESFDLLGSSENVADISAVAAGIAQALITTACGLIVALVTLFPHMFFRVHADRSLSEIEMLSAAHLNASHSA